MTGIAESGVIAKVHDHREVLDALAESDLRCSKYAKELLALADENGGDH